MKKIVIFTAEDYTFLFNAWCDFIDNSKDKFKIEAIFVFPDVLKNKKGLEIYKEYLKIMGFKDFFTLALKTLGHRLVFKNKKYSDFSDLGKKNNVRVFYKKNPNDEDVVGWIKKNEIDNILITFGYIIKPALIKAVRGCILNKHSALLPAFKGLWPIFWAMRYNAKIGATIHKVSTAIDAGEIILQKEYQNDLTKSVFDWYSVIYRDTADLFINALEALEGGKRRVLADVAESSCFSLPTKEEYRDFKKKQLKFA